MTDVVTSEIAAIEAAGEVCVTPRHKRPSRAKLRHICPVCKRPLANAIAQSTIVFPHVKSRIFNLIKARPGITARELAALVYERQDEAALASVRVHVCQMRAMLRDGTDMKIGSYAGTGYWVEFPNREPAIG